MTARPAPPTRRRAGVASIAVLAAAVAATAVVAAGTATASPTSSTTTTVVIPPGGPSAASTGTAATGAATTGTTSAGIGTVSPLGTPSVEAGPMARPATVTRTAKRLKQVGSIMFPMETEPICRVLSNYSESRSGGRSHEGIDIIASRGQDVYAVTDGTLTVQYIDGKADATLSGNAWKLTAADGSYTFYAHLDGFAPGLSVGSTVRRGDVIGYVGDTGNPGDGNYHLHFEVHPANGSKDPPAVNPLPLLDIPSTCIVW